jgi:hypothetical protein
MAEAGSGRAAANDAAVRVTPGGGALDLVGDARRNLDAAQAKVTKQEAHLAGAKQAVAEAKRQLAAAKRTEG